MSETHYSRIMQLLEGTSIDMVGNHEEVGQSYEFRDRNRIKVGEINFDNHDSFLGGIWYGSVVVSGRTLSKSLAFHVFTSKIEETHGG